MVQRRKYIVPWWEKDPARIFLSCVLLFGNFHPLLSTFLAISSQLVNCFTTVFPRVSQSKFLLQIVSYEAKSSGWLFWLSLGVKCIYKLYFLRIQTISRFGYHTGVADFPAVFSSNLLFLIFVMKHVRW